MLASLGCFRYKKRPIVIYRPFLVLDFGYWKMEQAILGAALMEHVKAYIDNELNARFLLFDSIDDTAESSSLDSAYALFFDPFKVNADPLALSLPTAFSLLSPSLVKHSDKDIVIISVSASGWGDFYQNLLSASLLHSEFLETAIKVQERFQFNLPPAEAYEAEVIAIAANSGSSGLNHWLEKHDQVLSSTLMLMFEAGKMPEQYNVGYGDGE